MGRYIGIGILYQVDLWRHAPKEELVKYHPEELFDYSSYESDNVIQLRTDIPTSELADLRSKVMDFCELPIEEHKDSSTGWKYVSFESELDYAIRSMSLEQLIELANKKEYYTFQECEQERLLRFCESKITAYYHFFLIYSSCMKFYPSRGYATHEVTRKVEGLINYGLKGNKLIDLVRCFVTQ